MPADRDALDRALDSGEKNDLPDNVPPGILGEPGLDLRKIDPDAHGDNAGLVQELSFEVRLLLIIIATLFVVTSPYALWLVWRNHKWKTWFKVAITAAIAVYVGWVLWLAFKPR